VSPLLWRDAAEDGDLMYAVAREAGRQLDRDATDVMLEILDYATANFTGSAARTVTLDRVLARFDVEVDTVSLKAQVDDRIKTLAAGLEASAPADREIDPDGVIRYASGVDLDALLADEVQAARDYRRARDAGLTLLDKDAFRDEWMESVDAGVDLVGTWASERGIEEAQVDDLDAESRAVTLMLDQDANEDRILDQQRQARIRNLERAAARAQDLADRMRGD
jgi:hypothetical protein